MRKLFAKFNMYNVYINLDKCELSHKYHLTCQKIERELVIVLIQFLLPHIKYINKYKELINTTFNFVIKVRK